jgi:hypothetical protein
MGWSEVEAVLPQAKSIAFDGCHKIYVLLDDEQVALMDTYGYGSDEGSFHLRRAEFASDGQILVKLSEWFTESCGLKFINAVRTVDGDPNLGFETLIGQFEFDDDDDEENGEYVW